MTAELSFRSLRIVAKKESAGYGKPDIPDHVRIACKAGKPVPVGHLDFCFRPINNGVSECDRKTNGRILDLIVIGIIVDVDAGSNSRPV